MSSFFLAGAGSRLLPPSVPFRYFGAAVAFHALAWIALLVGADAAPRFAGGLGWTLAALHLVTLGTLAMTAIGASLQLLPVATRRTVGGSRAPALIWWLYTPGVAVAALGMGAAAPAVLATGAVAVVVALAAFAVLLARNLLGAKGMPIVVAHGWAAAASLAVTLATAVALAGSYVGWTSVGRSAGLALHVVLAAFGFMGMLALGLSYILVPMFALAQAPDDRTAWISYASATAALAAAGVAAIGVAPRLLYTLAAGAGAVAVSLHLRLMTVALATGMRRHLGRSFALVRIGWALLVLALPLGLAVAHEVELAAVGTLFGVVLVAGWLLTFLLGILQRIVPFLASMHAARGKGLPPTPSALTADRPLRIHFGCHLAALALLAAGVVADSALAVRAAACAGTAGALAFGAFFASAMRRMRAPAVAGARAEPPA